MLGAFGGTPVADTVIEAPQALSQHCGCEALSDQPENSQRVLCEP
jgi:hypothetical protein